MIAELIPFLDKDWTPGAVGIWVIIAMIAIYVAREVRENRKLSSDDKQAKRQGFEATTKRLADENRALMADMATLRDENNKDRKAFHDEVAALRKENETERAAFFRENDQLRQMVVRLENRVAGYKRQVAALQIWLARHLGELGIPQDLIDRTTAALNLVDEADGPPIPPRSYQPPTG